MSAFLWIMLTASCGLDASHHPVRLAEKEKRKKKDNKPRISPRTCGFGSPASSLGPSRRRVLNMMNCRGQCGSARCPGELALGSLASLLQASQRRHARCCCISSVPMQASQITERDVSTPAWQSGEKRWVLQSREKLPLVTWGLRSPHGTPSILQCFL